MVLALRLVLPFALGYFLSYLYRSVNAVIADDLIADIGLEPAALGLLTAAYFISFAAFQLPLGLLLDRFGPRRVEAGLLLVAAAGALLFSFGDGLESLTAARALIGFGVSACLMAAFKNNILWWPMDRLPLMNGLILASGGLGALVATTPVAALLALTDWRGVFQLLAGVTGLSAALLFFVVPEPRQRPGPAPSFGDMLCGVGDIYRSSAFWRVAPVAVLSQATFMAYQGLWAAPWMAEVNGLDRATIAGHLESIAIGMTAGFVMLGFAASALDRRGFPMSATTTVLVALFLLLQASLVVPWVEAPGVQWLLFGMLGTGSTLYYAMLSRSFPSEFAGRANTALNLLAFIGAFTIQAGIGPLIQGFGALGFDAALAHRTTLTLIMIATALAFGWFLLGQRYVQERATLIPDQNRSDRSTSTSER